MRTALQPLSQLAYRARSRFSRMRGNSRVAGVRLTLRDASPTMLHALLNDYEMDDANLARRYVDRNSRVLELGSSCGFMALFCMRQLGVTDYAMVEANPRMTGVIEENFRLNGVVMPVLFEVAVGDRDDDVTLNIDRDFWASSTVCEADTIDRIVVPQRRLASIVKELSFRPDTLICDIEGAEALIAPDDWLLFDTIIAEFHGRLIGEQPVSRICGHLVSHGYRLAETAGDSFVFVREEKADAGTAS